MKSLNLFERKFSMILAKKCGGAELFTLNMNLPNILLYQTRVDLSNRSLDEVGKELPINQFSPILLRLNAIFDYIDRIDKSIPVSYTHLTLPTILLV